VIESIVDEALDDGDIVKFGLVLHPYADIFSHQYFSGVLSKVNDVKEVKVVTSSLSHTFSKHGIVNLFKNRNISIFDRGVNKILPTYGHAQSWDYPDMPFIVWKYTYDYSDEYDKHQGEETANNPERFRRAFTKIQEKLENFLNKHPEYRDENVKQINFEILFEALLKSGYLWWRIRNWKKVMTGNGLFGEDDDDILKYDVELWSRQAFKNYKKKAFDQRKVESAQIDANFGNTDIYQYYRGVKWYKQRFHYYCKQNGLDIPM